MATLHCGNRIKRARRVTRRTPGNYGCVAAHASLKHVVVVDEDSNLIERC